jgi:phosphoglycerate-specific signal transduction histidine kinase
MNEIQAASLAYAIAVAEDIMWRKVTYAIGLGLAASIASLIPCTSATLILSTLAIREFVPGCGAVFVTHRLRKKFSAVVSLGNKE